MLIGESFASTSEVLMSAILELLKLWNQKLWRRDHLQWNDLCTSFHENLPTGSKVNRGQTNRQEGDLISQLSFL
jgi:hypothetical protein